MDKDHLIELISNSLLYESKNSDSTKNLIDFKNYLERLNLDQLRTMSKAVSYTHLPLPPICSV